MAIMDFCNRSIFQVFFFLCQEFTKTTWWACFFKKKKKKSFSLNPISCYLWDWRSQWYPQAQPLIVWVFTEADFSSAQSFITSILLNVCEGWRPEAKILDYVDTVIGKRKYTLLGFIYQDIIKIIWSSKLGKYKRRLKTTDDILHHVIIN